ncbi:hypothetical protein GGR51DRAFT_341652 [Nemania sp. FL0031]|nr:hypothetical protein GGR51DRAFT_341652 [Nemania sp. FL0031]
MSNTRSFWRAVSQSLSRRVSSPSQRVSDEKKLQLKVIHDPEEEGNGTPNVDLVLVHGFAGDIIDTWTDKSGEEEVFWPKQLLSISLPQTRILSFGYDAGKSVEAGIRDYARTLLGYLNVERDVNIRSRPIVFLGHCLGGLIIRQAMRFATREEAYSSIATATKSIIFFGTPHGGGDRNGWLEIAQRYEEYGRGCKMIDILAKNTDDLIQINEDFCRLQAEYTILNFIEMRPLPGKKKLIVSKTSATQANGVTFEWVFVDADHLTMCQFNSSKDLNYRRICQVIEESAVVARDQKTALVLFNPMQPPQAAQVAPSQRMLPWHGQGDSFYTMPAEISLGIGQR